MESKGIKASGGEGGYLLEIDSALHTELYIPFFQFSKTTLHPCNALVDLGSAALQLNAYFRHGLACAGADG